MYEQISKKIGEDLHEFIERERNSRNDVETEDDNIEPSPIDLLDEEELSFLWEYALKTLAV